MTRSMPTRTTDHNGHVLVVNNNVKELPSIVQDVVHIAKVTTGARMKPEEQLMTKPANKRHQREEVDDGIFVIGDKANAENRFSCDEVPAEWRNG